MGVERLRLIGPECPAYAGDFAMTQGTARAIMLRDIDRDAACKKTADRADEAERKLERARWWQENGPSLTVVVGGGTLVIGIGAGFVAGEGLRR